jgi:uncharacterized glyoxalase superfamily protein PhnB
MGTRQLFLSMTYSDAEAGMAFLRAVGFTEALVVRSSDDPSVVEHAQFDWRDHGGVMFGSADRPRRDRFPISPGQARCYCVVAADADVDAVHAAALAAGGSSVIEPVDEDYGGRGCAVSDPEGNLWSFGSYAGE